LEVGVCGSNKKISSFRFGTPPAGYNFFVIGHEMLGEVVEVGSEVRDIKLGDLAVTAVRHPCLHDDCRACRMGHQDFCFTGDFTEHGIKETHGFMTEFVVDEERYMYLVPCDLRDVDVLTEPLTVAENAKQCVKRYAIPLATHDYHAILNQLCAGVFPFIPITPFHCIRSLTRGRLPWLLAIHIASHAYDKLYDNPENV
jgi:NADPH:quinone reductase-like Zn-dependent oxidoreductase